MTPAMEWQIPPSILRWVDDVPRDAPVVLLMRHSVRGYLPVGDAGYTVPITDIGVRLAAQLGRRIGPRLRSLHTSPILRCVQTCEALRSGANAALNVVHDRWLGDPGIYVHDNVVAGETWRREGHEAVMANLVSSNEPWPGLASPEPAARYLVHHMLAAAADEPGLHGFVTHDSLVTATAARLLGAQLTPSDWPWYLEAAFFWREGGKLHAAYRDLHRVHKRKRLCDLDPDDVIDLARRESAATIGPNHNGRFFLAGGAFKSLLTGRPPRDLDVWGPTPKDRALLVDSLRRRGAEQLAPRPFGEAFQVGGRIVEVPHHTAPPSLEERLARFDIGLSAVGAEHVGDGGWRVVIHPLAVESVRRRAVLLLKPLVNWRHSLATLERMRRYASELGFEVPAEETATIWEVFDAQTPEMQRGMLDRFALSARGGFGVREEAECRLR